MQLSELTRRFKTVKESHLYAKAFSTGNKEYRNYVVDYFTRNLLEDFGNNGDLTTKSVYPRSNGESKKKAYIICKQAGIAAGLDESAVFFAEKRSCFKSKIGFRKLLKDGTKVSAGIKVAELTGNAADILLAERTLLNIISRMSGIATFTHKFVEKVPANVLITPTRKTICGLLDKSACIKGGGGSHRINLGDAVLVKDNHIKLRNGSFAAIFKDLAASGKLGRFIEIEVETQAQARDAVSVYEKYAKQLKRNLYLLLDNMSAAEIRRIIKGYKNSKIYHHLFFEASGGINIKNVFSYAKTGVDIISIGALTHSAPALDMSLEMAS